MILLDENVDVLVRRRLRDWRIRFKHIGTSIGRRGMKDIDEILPLLHSLRKPTHEIKPAQSQDNLVETRAANTPAFKQTTR